MEYARAAVMVEKNRVETWKVPIFDPEPGGALVRVVVGGVCGSDAHIVSGEAGDMPFPIILGHEGVGRIERVGPGVETDYAGVPVKAGDLVCWAPIALCHRCHSCVVLEETPCENSTFFEHAERPNWGSYADYAWLPRGLAFFRLPDGAAPDAVAALGCALPTVLRGFERSGGSIAVGDTVLVQGAGPVGLAAVLYAAAAGAADIVVTDYSDVRLDTARKLGATEVVSLRDTTPEQRKTLVTERFGRFAPNVVVEAAGALPAFPEGLDLTGAHGRYIILGLWGAMGTQPVSPRDLTLKNMTVSGVSFPKPKHYYQAMHLSASMEARYGLSELITDRFSIEQAGSALEKLKTGTLIKPVIDPSL